MASPHRNSPVSFAHSGHSGDSDSSAGPQFLFTDVAHSKDLVTALRFLRRDEDLCDIVLRVGSTSISAHKVVLAASSPYFKAMFAGKLLECACLLASFNSYFICNPKQHLDGLKHQYWHFAWITQKRPNIGNLRLP